MFILDNENQIENAIKKARKVKPLVKDDRRTELDCQEAEADYFAWLATGLKRKGK